MKQTKHTNKELKLVKLLSDAIDELNQNGHEEIAANYQERLETLLGIAIDDLE